jgi:hypothetical protein
MRLEEVRDEIPHFVQITAYILQLDFGLRKTWQTHYNEVSI